MADIRLGFRNPVMGDAGAAQEVIRSYVRSATINDVRADLENVLETGGATARLIFAGRVWSDPAQLLTAALGSSFVPTDAAFVYTVMLLGGSSGTGVRLPIRFNAAFATPITRPVLATCHSSQPAVGLPDDVAAAPAPLQRSSSDGTVPAPRNVASVGSPLSVERAALAEAARRRLGAATDSAPSPAHVEHVTAPVSSPSLAAGSPSLRSVSFAPLPATVGTVAPSAAVSQTSTGTSRGIFSALMNSVPPPLDDSEEEARQRPSQATQVAAAPLPAGTPPLRAATDSSAALVHALAAAQAATAAAAAGMGMPMPGLMFGMVPPSPSLHALGVMPGMSPGMAGWAPPALMHMPSMELSPALVAAGPPPFVMPPSPLTTADPLMHPQLRRLMSGGAVDAVGVSSASAVASAVTSSPMAVLPSPIVLPGPSPVLAGVSPASPGMVPMSPMLAAMVQQQYTIAHHINALQVAQQQLLSAHANSPVMRAASVTPLPPSFSLGEAAEDTDGLRRRRSSKARRGSRDEHRAERRKSRGGDAAPASPVLEAHAADATAAPEAAADVAPAAAQAEAAAAGGGFVDIPRAPDVGDEPVRPPGLRRYVDIGLLVRLAVFALLFFHGASQARLTVVAVVLSTIYLLKVGLIADVLAAAKRCFGRPPPPPAVAPVAAPLPPPAAGGDAAPVAPAPPPAPPVNFYTSLLIGLRGYILVDAFAFVVAFFVSLVPAWQPDQELLPHAPPAAARAA